MKNKDIVSALIGSAFFAIPYIALDLSLAPSLIAATLAFGAGELVFSSFKEKNKNDYTELTIEEKIENASKINKEIRKTISDIENEKTRANLKEITITTDKILKKLRKNPKQANSMNNFFEYYIPDLLKIIKRYDEIENQKLMSKDGKEFILRADQMIEKTNESFRKIHASLYQNDIMNLDADMKIYNLMLEADGMAQDDSIVKESGLDEK